MRFPPVFSVVCFFLAGTFANGDVSDCFWGGFNEQTNYSSSYFPGQGGVTLAQLPQPNMNLGTPQPAIPVQATQNTQSVNVPQVNIPTVSIPVGQVGSVGQPATNQSLLPNAAPGQEIVYVMPSGKPSDAVCIDGKKSIPATESKVVPAGTPGAVPVALKTVTVRRPKTEYHWTYAPVVTKTDTLVKVVNPRTGRVVNTYCKQNEESTYLPYVHRRETVTYETITTKIGTPVSIAPTTSAAANTAVLNPPASYQSRYPEGGESIKTVIIP